MEKITKKNIEKEDNKVLLEQESINIVKDSSWKPYTVMGLLLAAITFMFMFIAYGWDNQNKTVIILSITTFLGIFLGIAGLLLVKQTVTFRIGLLLLRMRKKKNQGYVVLKIFDVSGRPQYRIVKASPRIVYPYIENGETKKKVVFYDPYGKYEDFGGIPVIECNPNDVQLKNTFNGSRIGTAPEIIEKNIVDNSISAQQIDSLKKQRKWILIALGIIVGGCVLVFDLYGQRLAAANEATVTCYKEMGKSATIIAGGFVRVGYNKFKEMLK